MLPAYEFHIRILVHCHDCPYDLRFAFLGNFHANTVNRRKHAFNLAFQDTGELMLYLCIRRMFLYGKIRSEADAGMGVFDLLEFTVCFDAF